jgi:DNA-binding MarR family transcriptional regulator
MACPERAASIAQGFTYEGRSVTNPHPEAARLLEHFARRALSRRLLCDLTPHQWAILRFVSAKAKACSLRQVARALGAGVRAADRCISALERMNYVAVAREGALDSVRLTEAGRTKLADDPLHRIDAALIRLPPQDKHELCRMLAVLLDAHVLDDQAQVRRPVTRRSGPPAAHAIRQKPRSPGR